MFSHNTEMCTLLHKPIMYDRIYGYFFGCFLDERSLCHRFFLFGCFSFHDENIWDIISKIIIIAVAILNFSTRGRTSRSELGLS